MLVVDQAATSKRVGYYGSYVELAFIFAFYENIGVN
jgi:hypothetical protein